MRLSFVRRLSRNSKAFTFLELLFSLFLSGIIFLALIELYSISDRFRKRGAKKVTVDVSATIFLTQFFTDLSSVYVDRFLFPKVELFRHGVDRPKKAEEEAKVRKYLSLETYDETVRIGGQSVPIFRSMNFLTSSSLAYHGRRTQNLKQVRYRLVKEKVRHGSGIPAHFRLYRDESNLLDDCEFLEEKVNLANEMTGKVEERVKDNAVVSKLNLREADRKQYKIETVLVLRRIKNMHVTFFMDEERFESEKEKINAFFGGDGKKELFPDTGTTLNKKFVHGVDKAIREPSYKAFHEWPPKELMPDFDKLNKGQNSANQGNKSAGAAGQAVPQKLFYTDDELLKFVFLPDYLELRFSLYSDDFQTEKNFSIVVPFLVDKNHSVQKFEEKKVAGGSEENEKKVDDSEQQEAAEDKQKSGVTKNPVSSA
jgi:hypothetical protein